MHTTIRHTNAWTVKVFKIAEDRYFTQHHAGGFALLDAPWLDYPQRVLADKLAKQVAMGHKTVFHYVSKTDSAILLVDGVGTFEWSKTHSMWVPWSYKGETWALSWEDILDTTHSVDVPVGTPFRGALGSKISLSYLYHPCTSASSPAWVYIQINS